MRKKRDNQEERQGQPIKKSIAALFDLPKEIVLGLPLISMIGFEEFTIENYKGIVEYTDEKLRVATTVGILRLEGKRLCLKQITTEQITVMGRIAKIEYLS